MKGYAGLCPTESCGRPASRAYGKPHLTGLTSMSSTFDSLVTATREPDVGSSRMRLKTVVRYDAGNGIHTRVIDRVSPRVISICQSQIIGRVSRRVLESLVE